MLSRLYYKIFLLRPVLRVERRCAKYRRTPSEPPLGACCILACTASYPQLLRTSSLTHPRFSKLTKLLAPHNDVVLFLPQKTQRQNLSHNKGTSQNKYYIDPRYHINPLLETIMTLSSGAAIAVGLVLVVFAGFLNGSWNASFSPTHGLAVKRVVVDAAGSDENSDETKEDDDKDLTYHLSWIMFQVYSGIINVPICLWWAGGPERVQSIVQESSSVDMALICIFSILWGGGSVGFGLACQVAGVGLGTNLCMGTSSGRSSIGRQID